MRSTGFGSIKLLGLTFPCTVLCGSVNDERKCDLNHQENWTKFKRASDALTRFKEKSGAPGVSVAVSYNNKIVWKTDICVYLFSGVGYADVENLVPCTDKTVMRIASISKPITMTILAQLMDDGKVDLDAPIQKYIPDFPPKKFDNEEVAITLRHLTSHLSGIRHYSTKEEIDSQNASKKQKCEKCGSIPKTRPTDEFKAKEYHLAKEFKSTSESMSLFKNDSLLSTPGKEFNYSTHAWTLVSAVIETVSGKKVEKMFDELFKELDLNSTSLDRNSLIIPNRGRYYKRCSTRNSSNCSTCLENVRSVNCSYKWAGGGIQSTVVDLLKFANFWVSSANQPCCHDNPSKSGSTSATQPLLSKQVVSQCWTSTGRQSSLIKCCKKSETSQHSNQKPKFKYQQSTLDKISNDKLDRKDCESFKNKAADQKEYESWRQRQEEAINSAGLGWFVSVPKSTSGSILQRRGMAYHAGGAIGATSFLLIVPPSGKNLCHGGGYEHEKQGGAEEGHKFDGVLSKSWREAMQCNELDETNIQKFNCYTSHNKEAGECNGAIAVAVLVNLQQCRGIQAFATDIANIFLEEEDCLGRIQVFDYGRDEVQYNALSGCGCGLSDGC